MAEWYGVADSAAQERLLAAWPDAPLENLEVCRYILSTAREQVIAVAPSPLPEVLPDNYVLAQLYYATKVWNLGRSNGDAETGADGFAFSPRLLEANIKALIRQPDLKPHAL